MGDLLQGFMGDFPPGSRVRLTREGAQRLKLNEQAKKVAVFSGGAALAATMFFDGGIGVGIFGTAIGVSEGALVAITTLLSAAVAALSVDRIQQMEGKVVTERVSKAKIFSTVLLPGIAFSFGLLGMLRGQSPASAFLVIDVDWQFRDAETGELHFLRRSHLAHHLTPSMS